MNTEEKKWVKAVVIWFLDGILFGCIFMMILLR